MRTVLANPGRFDKGLVLLYIAKGKKRPAAEIVPKLSRDNLLLSATSSIGTAPILTTLVRPFFLASYLIRFCSTLAVCAFWAPLFALLRRKTAARPFLPFAMCNKNLALPNNKYSSTSYTARRLHSRSCQSKHSGSIAICNKLCLTSGYCQLHAIMAIYG
jgi:hypothetical protein